MIQFYSLPILLLALAFSSAVPMDNSGSGAPELLNPEDVDNNKKTDFPRLNCLKELQSRFADDNGKPKSENLDDYPTSIFCIPDYDIVKNQSRAAAGSQKCSTVYWFLFKLDSEPGDRQLSLSNANLRVYLNTIKRHLVENQNVSVGISTIVSLNEIGSGNFSSPIDDTWVYMRSIEVNSNSDGWLELNITEELGSVWDPDFTTREPIFNITLKFDVDCKQQKKVPLKITNPATIREFKAKRERQLEHQPFLAVYTTDDEILKMAKTRSYYYSNDVPVTTDEAEERRKRNAQTTVNSTCHIDDFTVRFSDLYLHHILWPETVKIQRCVGSCAYKYIHSASSLTTNHARILITSHLLYQIHRSNNPNTTIAEPLLPCCTPVKYRPIFLITAVGYYSFESNLYLDFIVEQCGCR